MASRRKRESIMELARWVASVREESWKWYDQLSAFMPTPGQIAQASTGDLDNLVSQLHDLRPPQLGAVYEALRMRARDGCEPENPVPLRLSHETVEEIRRLTRFLGGNEVAYHGRASELREMLHGEDREVMQAVVDILPPSVWRDVIIERMVDDRAPAPGR